MALVIYIYILQTIQYMQYIQYVDIAHYLSVFEKNIHKAECLLYQVGKQLSVGTAENKMQFIMC
jgi:hypothetical protein